MIKPSQISLSYRQVVAGFCLSVHVEGHGFHLLVYCLVFVACRRFAAALAVLVVQKVHFFQLAVVDPKD